MRSLGTRRVALFAGAATVTAVALAGCSAGQVAATAVDMSAIQGVNAQSTTGSVLIRNLAVKYDGIAGYQPGANAPIWVFSVEGTAVKVTRVAVDESVTVDPPPWNADDPPEGISIESATGREDSKKLSVSFIGARDGAEKPCGADYAAEAVESDLAVVVIVSETRTGAGACDLVGYPRTAKVTLDSALGNRAVLEVKQGLPVPVTAP